jgi:hypothetical protein
VQEHDDGEHAQPDTCTIEPSDVTHSVQLERIGDSDDVEGDGSDDDGGDAPADADGAADAAPRRRRRRRR